MQHLSRAANIWGRLPLLLCLERCSLYSSVANIRGCMATIQGMCTHVLLSVYDTGVKNMVIQGKRRKCFASKALHTSTTSARHCGLHFWERSWLLPLSPRTTTTGMLCVCVCVCVWRRMVRASAMYCASNVLFSTAAISSCLHHVFALEAVATTPLTNIMKATLCSVYLRAATILLRYLSSAGIN